MKLYIDTSNSENIFIKLDERRIDRQSREKRSQTLLYTIEKELTKEGKTLHDIEEIEVNTGPGSFTGLRVGVSVANALGYALGIKVNGKDVLKSGPVEPNY